jgi:hypothetical protein
VSAVPEPLPWGSPCSIEGCSQEATWRVRTIEFHAAPEDFSPGVQPEPITVVIPLGCCDRHLEDAEWQRLAQHVGLNVLARFAWRGAIVVLEAEDGREYRTPTAWRPS